MFCIHIAKLPLFFYSLKFFHSFSYIDENFFILGQLVRFIF